MESKPAWKIESPKGVYLLDAQGQFTAAEDADAGLATILNEASGLFPADSPHLPPGWGAAQGAAELLGGKAVYVGPGLEPLPEGAVS